MLLLLLLFVCTIDDSVTMGIDRKPVNVLVEYGQSTIVQCCSKDNSFLLEWQHYSAGLFHSLCRGEVCHRAGYSIDYQQQTDGCSNLIIESTNSSSAGLYQCNQMATTDATSAVGVYVVAYNFSCTSNHSNGVVVVDGNIVMFQCTISWTGKLPFETRWLTEDGTRVPNSTRTHSEEKSVYVSTLTVDAKRPLLPSYSIQLAFLNTGITDANVDRFCPTVNWTSSKERVLYPVTDIRLSCPVKDCRRKTGDLINCSADGLPIPEFQWLNWNRMVLANGAVLKLTSSSAETTETFTCVAANTIRGQRHEVKMEVTVRQIEEKEDKDGGDTMNHRLITVLTVSMIVIGVIVLLVLVALLIEFRAIRQVLTTLLEQKQEKSEEEEKMRARSNRRTRLEQETGIEIRTINVSRDGEMDRKSNAIKGERDEEESQSLLSRPVQVTQSAHPCDI